MEDNKSARGLITFPRLTLGLAVSGVSISDTVSDEALKKKNPNQTNAVISPVHLVILAYDRSVHPQETRGTL